MLSTIATAAKAAHSIVTTNVRPTSLAMATAEHQAARSDSVVFPMLALLGGVIAGATFVIAVSRH
jgi:hypothetical protein